MKPEPNPNGCEVLSNATIETVDWIAFFAISVADWPKANEQENITVSINSSYIIDIIENNFPKKIQHQKLNNFIKIVCKLTGIDTLVKGTKLNTETNRKELGMFPKYDLMASHCFRRSFATNFYKIIPTAVLITITGHSKESLFLTYINKREDKDANADLFKQFYENLNKDKQPQLKVIKNRTND